VISGRAGRRTAFASNHIGSLDVAGRSQVGVPGDQDTVNSEELAGGAETRQRVDRWIEESQYLLGRIIPGILEDRERLRGRAEAAENACEQLGLEASNLRREVSELHLEIQGLRSELAEIGRTAGAVIEHLTQSIHPISELHQKLQRNNLLDAKPYLAAAG